MRRVLLKKIAHDPSGEHVSFERVFEGWEEREPTVGKPYTLMLDSGRILKTSNVVKIMEGYLVTENSLYKFNLIENKPFDLGIDRLRETRELVFPKEPSDEDQKDRLFSLSAREREVFQLLAEGLSVKETANLLNISPKTVETYKHRIMEKLQIRSISELIKEAIRSGIVPIES